VLDDACAIDEHADLAADVGRERGQLAGELVRDEAVGEQPPLTEALEGLDLAGLEAAGIAVDLDGGLLARVVREAGSRAAAPTGRAATSRPVGAGGAGSPGPRRERDGSDDAEG